MDLGNLVLRIVAGVSMIMFHSWQKLVDLFNFLNSGKNWKLVDMIQTMGLPLPVLFAILVALIEFTCSLLIILGLFTRVSSMLLSIVMLGAIFFHIVTKSSFELPLIYLSLFSFLVIAGAGKFSLDSKLGKK